MLLQKTRALLAAAATVSAIAFTPAAASPAPAGAVGNKASYAPEISGTGRYIVFASDATNLVAGDTNAKRDIFIRDTVAKTTRKVTKGLTGQSNGNSFTPKVSDDGRYVAFLSDATNLVTGDTNNVTDAFRADLSTGKIIRVSVGAAGKQANKVTRELGMNATGNSIVFSSDATNLVAGDTNGKSDVFLRDLALAAPKRLSNIAEYAKPTISPDGNWVSYFAGWSGNLMAWNRQTNQSTVACEVTYDGNAESWCDEGVASNAGVSYLYSGFYGCCTYVAGMSVVAQPASLSFGHDWGRYYDGSWPTGVLDITKFGSMVVVRDDSRNGLHELVLMDKTGILGYLGVNSSAVALASGGGSVVYVDANKQIALWNRSNASTTIVSVN